MNCAAGDVDNMFPEDFTYTRSEGGAGCAARRQRWRVATADLVRCPVEHSSLAARRTSVQAGPGRALASLAHTALPEGELAAARNESRGGQLADQRCHSSTPDCKSSWLTRKRNAHLAHLDLCV